MLDFLYNGIALPKLPEWDKETYPYVCIEHRKNAINYQDHYIAYFTQYPVTVKGDVIAELESKYTLRLYLPEESTALRNAIIPYYDSEWSGFGENTVYEKEGEWYISDGGSRFAPEYGVIWSNFDILYRTANEDAGIAVGDIYLAASDPVPVGSAPEVEPKAFMNGWDIGQYVRGMQKGTML